MTNQTRFSGGQVSSEVRGVLVGALALVAVCTALIVGCHGAGALPFSKTVEEDVTAPDGTLVATNTLTLEVDHTTGLPGAYDSVEIHSEGWTYETDGPIRITEEETTFTASRTYIFTETATSQTVIRTVTVTMRKPMAPIPTGAA